MTRIGFLGAFSIDNAGDALLNYAGRQAMRALVPDAEHVVFAPQLPHGFCAHDFGRERGIDQPIVPVPASEDMRWAADLDALVIGSGGLIQLDPSFRPFLLGDPSAWDPARPAAWSALCSQNQPWYLHDDQGGYEAVRVCCERLRYVSVRSRATETFVRRCGYTGDLHVVPDPAILLDVPAAVDAEVDEVLRASGVLPGHRLIGVTIGTSIEDPRAATFYRGLFATLNQLRADSPVPVQIVLFPWSYLRNDPRLLELALPHLPGALVVRPRLGALALWRLVGKMSFYVASRYHAMVTAFAQDVPFVILDENLSDLVATSKTREFIVDQGLEAHYLSPFLTTNPAWKLEGVFHAGDRVSFAPAIAACRERLRAHYARMVRALGL
ncbi:MAG: polysaccharide pyruvyl transferase family protein [Deltaproteobacteria bacterium]|nr:polysaccharide pyruvyl transferase family protein [Deltaproteobacteria bacterium]